MDGPWHKVNLQRYVETRTPGGGQGRTYSTLATIWVKFRTLSGNERMLGQQANAVQTHEASMVYEASLVPHVDWRLVWGSRTFDIRDVRNVDEMNTEIRMRLTEVPTMGPVTSPSPSASPSMSASASPSASPSA